jgi:replicative DNA helicase
MAEEIEKFKKSKDRLTGFPNLDELAGGINSGLYVLAAISSLGKTTLALQMADQLAAAGHEVLFFSMEQSRLEMVTKSLARLTAQADMRNAVDSLSIRRGYTPAQVMAAAQKYRELCGERLSIIEGNFNCDTAYIGEYVRNYKRRTGSTPIVFIDYLQVLKPAPRTNGKQARTTKDEIDISITELKQLSRAEDVPIIAISSVNRANYLTPFSFESLKESGNIEYTADVVWGLQLACLDEDIFGKEGAIKAKRERVAQAKDENPRKIKFLCEKNRYGRAHFDVNFNYYPKFDLFIPGQPSATQEKAGRMLTATGRRKA